MAINKLNESAITTDALIPFYDPDSGADRKATVASLATLIGAASSTTDLTATAGASSVVVGSSSGADATILPATASNAGVATATQIAKLDGIEAGATGDQTGAEIRDLLDTLLGGTAWRDNSSSNFVDITRDFTTTGTSTTFDCTGLTRIIISTLVASGTVNSALIQVESETGTAVYGVIGYPEGGPRWVDLPYAASLVRFNVVSFSGSGTLRVGAQG